MGSQQRHVEKWFGFCHFFGDKHSVQLGGAAGWGIAMNHSPGGLRVPVRMGGGVL